MATFRESAVAAHRATEAQARDALVARARVTVLPVMTDPAGKVLLDPKALLVVAADVPSGTVVFGTPEPSEADRTFLAVRNDTVRLTTMDAGAWRSDGAQVRSLVEAGAALQAEAAA